MHRIAGNYGNCLAKANRPTRKKSVADAWCAYHDAMVATVHACAGHSTGPTPLRLFRRRGGLGTYTQGAVTIEEILKWNPDAVNAGRSYPAGLVKNDLLWKSVAAMRHSRIAETPDGVFYRDGSSEGVFLMLYVAKEPCPKRFADFDLAAAVQDHYGRLLPLRSQSAEIGLVYGRQGARR